MSLSDVLVIGGGVIGGACARALAGAGLNVTMIDPGPLRRVRDFPANGERLTAEEPVGVRHVLVNGVLIREDEQSRVESFSAAERPGVRPKIV